MKKQIRNAKAKLTRVEMTPFPVWKKLYFILMATVGTTSLTCLAGYLLLKLLGIL